MKSDECKMWHAYTNTHTHTRTHTRTHSNTGTYSSLALWPRYVYRASGFAKRCRHSRACRRKCGDGGGVLRRCGLNDVDGRRASPCANVRTHPPRAMLRLLPWLQLPLYGKRFRRHRANQPRGRATRRQQKASDWYWLRGLYKMNDAKHWDFAVTISSSESRRDIILQADDLSSVTCVLSNVRFDISRPRMWWN